VFVHQAHQVPLAFRTPRRSKPYVFPVTAIDDPALPEVLAELAAARADAMDADTVNRELSIARKAIGWWAGRISVFGFRRRSLAG
jgi:hypothetical protein